MRTGTMTRVACGLWVLTLASSSRADQIVLGLTADQSNKPPGGWLGGERIPFDVWMHIDDVEGNGPDSQGVAGFAFDVITNTGIVQNPLSFAATSTLYPTVTIRADDWVTAPGGPLQLGGFGFSAVGDGGNVTFQPGQVRGAGAGMAPIWIADVDNDPSNGRQPKALHNIGFDRPPGIDVGGHPVPPMGPRDDWFLMDGEVNVPNTPGIYEVSISDAAANLIKPDRDLNFDVTHGYVFGASNVLGGRFTFRVIPEPHFLAVFGLGALHVIRRRRST